ncbi:MAG: hypothetical protein ACYDCQ_19770, partial [Dehalococcoidia bacterium]
MRFALALLLAGGVGVAVLASAVHAQPPVYPDDRVYGTVTLDGSNAPAGVDVAAYAGISFCGSAVYDGSRYTLDLDSRVGACFTPGDVISFRV